MALRDHRPGARVVQAQLFRVDLEKVEILPQVAGQGGEQLGEPMNVAGPVAPLGSARPRPVHVEGGPDQAGLELRINGERVAIDRQRKRVDDVRHAQLL
jgi:hypothetical protein